MPVLLNVEGKLCPPEEAVVPVMDRGFLYGDSVYEVVRTYGGRVFELDRHLKRMEQSAERIGLVLPPRQKVIDELQRTLDAAKNPESYARIIVTRGDGEFGLGAHLAGSQSRLIFMIRPLVLPTEAQYEKGLSLAVARTRRNSPQTLDPALKTGNYLNNVMALREAHAAGADDAVLLDLQGRVTEATTSNIFFVHNNVIVTPPLRLGMLEGVTRAVTLIVAQREGLLTREEPHGPEALAAADEVFLTSTIREVMPVTQLIFLESTGEPKRPVGDGKPGPVAKRLRDAFKRYVEGQR
ncbi:MAG TPA: aminotransferase class IV [Myxococcales bacterium]|nr:aminotransferase class IV [Myxococcales bacterium]